jgi:hypothetical protein
MFQIVNPEGDGSIFLCNVSKFLQHQIIEGTIPHNHCQL